jgi:hypothetical protein
MRNRDQNLIKKTFSNEQNITAQEERMGNFDRMTEKTLLETIQIDRTRGTGNTKTSTQD